MAFHDVRLPQHIERGATGGPRFRTSVKELRSGREKRNKVWSRSKGAWNIGYGIQSKSRHDLTTVIEFFYGREGRAHTFRFKDWSDYEIGDADSSTPQEIGIGDGAEVDFQIYRRYTSGSVTFQRPVTKIVGGTLEVYVDGILQTEGAGNDYTVDLTTGIITFNSALGSGLSVAVICEFDVHARFERDELDINMETFDAGSIPDIIIKEMSFA